MIRAVVDKLPGLLIVSLIALALAACGGEKDSGPPPTVADINLMATRAAVDATVTALSQPPAASPSATVEAAALPTFTATVTMVPDESVEAPPSTPTASLTVTPTVSSTAVPSATNTATVSPEDEAARQQATGIALTNTAAAGAMPITQTVEAIRHVTETAIAAAPPTATHTPTPTVEMSPTTPAPADLYQVVFYGDRYGNEDIFLLKLDGTVHALTGGPANEREPSCAPDASAVVYASDASGRFQLYLQRLDSTDPIQLTDSKGMNFAPMFSPDGATIAFVSTRNGGIPTIWLMDVDGGNQRQLTAELGRDTSPNWGPDSRQLLFASDQEGPWDLFLTVVGEDVQGEFPLLPPVFSEGNQVWPLFDSTGARIAYTRWDDLNDPQTADIYLLDYEQPEPLVIRDSDAADIAWGWGDDTHLLASIGEPGDVQIALVDIGTGEVAMLTDTGTFNGGARLCTVNPAILPPEPTPAPSPTPTFTPSATPTETPSPTPTITPTPSPTPPPLLSPALEAAQGQRHVVQVGDNLETLGYTYGVDWATLAEINGLDDPNRVYAGQELIVPVTRRGRYTGGYQNPNAEEEGISGPVKVIVVKLNSQRVYVYENGKAIRTISVSTGLPGTPTVQGEFHIYHKTESQTMSGPGYYLPGVPYVMYFYQDYGLHGTYWHENFGQPMSHGCVNLPTPDAKWLYEWADVGTPVLVSP
ncbi:MAG: L,D-transpeptidase family protein [Anaerolineae bacterium]|nr:L,D-transpeptidase family protein [Anaerolineae bacterium]